MAKAATKGAIRPIDHEILQGVLAELEAASDLVEQVLISGDSHTIATIRASLAAMLGMLCQPTAEATRNTVAVLNRVAADLTEKPTDPLYIRASAAWLRTMAGHLDSALRDTAADWVREQQARHQATMREIEDAIESNPTLRYLRSEDGDPRIWEAAVANDRELQKDPDWSCKPVTDRLAEVVRQLAANGLVASVGEVFTHG